MFKFAKAKSDRKPEASPQRQGEPDFRTAEALAAKALMLASAYRTPPVPKTYEVWYAYASGAPAEVTEKINTIIGKSGGLGTYELDQIHLEYLAMSERERKHHDALGLHLDHEIDEIAKLVQSHITSSDSYSGSLKQTAASLSAQATPAQVRAAIATLLSENAKMTARTSKLGEALAESRAQVRKLRVSLEKSRDKEMRDPMTNLANRRLFELRLAREITDAQRTGVPLCLVLIDLDHFKVINDTFGHPVGDDVLRFFAGVLSANVKGRDLAARYGGEEFVLVLPDTRTDEARHVIRRIMEQVEQTRLVLMQGKAPVGKLTASYGVAQFRSGDDSLSLLERADARLYEAKKAGRNRVVSGS
ncbi:MAG: GGDEF domain-containing protein [Oricola sp.]